MNPIYPIIASGATLLLLLAFQVLLGLRKIKFKGRLHAQVHKWVGIGMLALAVLHGGFAAGTLLGWF